MANRAAVILIVGPNSKAYGAYVYNLQGAEDTTRAFLLDQHLG